MPFVATHPDLCDGLIVGIISENLINFLTDHQVVLEPTPRDQCNDLPSVLVVL